MREQGTGNREQGTGKRGFTLLELMVASLLMAMLMTILTMIFNQSSIAWSTGTASVVSLGNVRRDISENALLADNALETEGSRPGLQVVSVWDPEPSGTSVLRTDTQGRAVDRRGITGKEMRDPLADEPISLGGGNAAGKQTFVVGVTSNGPDGEPETWDDITTYPEDRNYSK